jgi:hypothetical protein
MANLHQDAQVTNLAQHLAVLDVKLAELRELVREANGTLKDLRDERRKGEELLARKIEGEVAKRLEMELAVALKAFGIDLGKAIESSTQAVYDRFDLIAGICLGEDAVSRRQGKAPLEELIRAYIRKYGPIT